jgi:hypothetical protein
MNNQLEIYVNITCYPNYQVSNFGNVKNIKSGRILKPDTCDTGYFRASLMNNGKKSNKKIHKLVANAFLENPEDKKCIDHKDRCKTNNHISNLRYATHTENNQNKAIQSNNTSGVVGVYWYKKNNKWCAQIRINGVNKSLGYFIIKDDAITARTNAEIQYFGEFRAIIPT